MKLKLLLLELKELFSFFIKLVELAVNLINELLDFYFSLFGQIGTLSIINFEIKEVGLNPYKLLFEGVNFICSLCDIFRDEALTELIFDIKDVVVAGFGFFKDFVDFSFLVLKCLLQLFKTNGVSWLFALFYETLDLVFLLAVFGSHLLNVCPHNFEAVDVLLDLLSQLKVICAFIWY